MADEISLDFGTLNFDSTNNITISKIDIKESKSVKAYDIPKSDSSVAETAKRKGVDITISGDIAGTAYDDLRTNLDTLKAGLQNGKQKFTLDDDRYIMGQLKSFSSSFVKLQIMATWKAVFYCEDPIWLAETATVDSRIPVSGVGYVLNNAGNATVRAKIEVFPLSIMTDDLQIENTTQGSLLKYRGTVTPQISNGDFELWTSGTSVAPDGWATGGAGVAVAREGTIKKISTYSAKLTRNGTDCRLVTNPVTTKGLTYWKGNTLLVGCWVYATVADRARIRLLHNGTGTDVYSSYHTGDSSWQFLYLTVTIPDDATDFLIYLHINNGDTDAYFDGVRIYNVTNAGVGLEIDNRYDSEDFEVLNDGDDDTANFEGDFLTLSPGNNTIEVTGGVDANVRITYRNGWY